VIKKQKAEQTSNPFKGKVLLFMTISLDGFINYRNGGVDSLYSDLSELRKTKMLQELIKTTGAVVIDISTKWQRETT
jgi:hypothetical protein